MLTIERLGITTMDIMGENCITTIGCDSREWDEVIEIKFHTDIDGIQSSLGSYRLVALRILYADGSVSPWLQANESVSRKWFKTCKG
jgi:hypothetical protein